MKREIITLCILVMLLVSVPFCFAAPTKAATTKLVAITFDDGPGAYTAELLDGLKARGAHATFFCVGTQAKARLSIVKREVSEGHQIGNHTTNHPQLTKLSAAGIRDELNNCRKYLVQAGGEQTYYVRPPYGSYNSTVKSVANAPLILWSVDTLDWKYRNADTVYNNIMRETKDGSIVLLHDLYKTSVQGALRAITDLKKQGYEFVTVKELLRRRGIQAQNGYNYSSAYNYGITLPAEEAPGPPATPTITAVDVWGGKSVSVACATKGAAIYYTTDGSVPTASSNKYGGAITVTATTRIRTKSKAELWGGEKEATIWVLPAPMPGASYQDGKLTLTGETMYYTTDGTTPTAKSKAYTAPIATTGTVRVLVRKKGASDRLMTYTPTKYGKLLTDVRDTDWYYDAVGESIHRGLLAGMGETEFGPETTVTRGMFVTALSRLAGADTTQTQTDFTDVKKSKWYAGAVAWAAQNGITKGMSETKFEPERGITREQMCVMLCRYADFAGVTMPDAGTAEFADEAEISKWARTDVMRLYHAGLISGMGKHKFAPRDNATRAQCAKLFVSFDNFIAE